ncbi:MAG: 2-oxo acid dehydrogenase subunit E2 [Lentisphaeria bacterium]|nr:2-oxo acid dehydrogenase subunit E2 [Lentisphaeria bacterium]
MANFILMPQMGVSDESAVLSQWLVKEGDKIELEQPLFSMETGKSSFEELAKYSGTLLKIVIPAGEEVKVGEVVAVVGEPGEKYELPGGAAAAPAAEAAPAPAAAPAAEAAPAPAAAAPVKNGNVNFILMPQMGVSDESAILSQWLVKEGDKIELEQPLFAMETGKSSFEELAKSSGTLLKIVVPAGEEVKVGEVVAVVGEPGESFTLPGAAPAAAPAAEAAAPAAAPAAAAPAAPAAAAKSADGFVAASPRAKHLAAELGIDYKLATPTGAEGRITEKDVKALAASGITAAPAAAEAAPAAAPAPAAAAPAAAAPAADAAYEDTPITRIRKVIADNMHASLANMAQLTLNRTFDATALLEMRKAMKNAEGFGLEKVTINDLVLFAVAKTLLEFPDINANFIDNKMRRFKHAQLGVAIDTPKGLLVPVIPDADTLSVKAISDMVKSYASAAKAGTLGPDKMQGGSFTVTNLGNLGIESFTPIINPPQTAILGVCGTTLRPRMKADGSVEFYQAMGLSLTFDHRVVDGAPAATFLKALADKLEKINLLFAL